MAILFRTNPGRSLRREPLPVFAVVALIRFASTSREGRPPIEQQPFQQCDFYALIRARTAHEALVQLGADAELMATIGIERWSEPDANGERALGVVNVQELHTIGRLHEELLRDHWRVEQSRIGHTRVLLVR